MINIIFNEQMKQISDTETLQNLLIQNHQYTQPVAVALNDKFVPKMHYSTTFLKEGDRVDLIVPMQGG